MSASARSQLTSKQRYYWRNRLSKKFDCSTTEIEQFLMEAPRTIGRQEARRRMAAIFESRRRTRENLKRKREEEQMLDYAVEALGVPKLRDFPLERQSEWVEQFVSVLNEFKTSPVVALTEEEIKQDENSDKRNNLNDMSTEQVEAHRALLAKEHRRKQREERRQSRHADLQSIQRPPELDMPYTPETARQINEKKAELATINSELQNIRRRAGQRLKQKIEDAVAEEREALEALKADEALLLQ